jgi:hypothetical protein
MLGMFGTAIFFGDGVITPAISVLSAVEGLEVARPRCKPWVIPLTLLVLTGCSRCSARHRRWAALRPDHGGVVRRAGGAGRAAHRGNPRCWWR